MSAVRRRSSSCVCALSLSAVNVCRVVASALVEFIELAHIESMETSWLLLCLRLNLSEPMETRKTEREREKKREREERERVSFVNQLINGLASP